MKYVSLTGLQHFWEKVKTYIDGLFEEIPTATTTADGLMSAADKTKLDAHSKVLAQHDANQLCVSTINKVTCTATEVDLNVTGTYFTDPEDKGTTNYVFPSVTTDKAGVMTAADKTKLDGIEEGATKIKYTTDVAYIDPTANIAQINVVSIPAVLNFNDRHIYARGDYADPSDFRLPGSTTYIDYLRTNAGSLGSLYVDYSNGRIVNVVNNVAYIDSSYVNEVARVGDYVYCTGKLWLVVTNKGGLYKIPTTLSVP